MFVRLPRRVAPVEDETTDSYVARLAQAHHLAFADLAAHLNPRLAGADGVARRFDVQLDALAAVCGIPAERLALALPEFRHQDRPGWSRSRDHARVGPDRVRRPACRGCMAARNIFITVWLWAPRHQNVCLRHQMWVGMGVAAVGHQFDVHDVPEIPSAQTRHRRLAVRRGPGPVNALFDDAVSIIEGSICPWDSSGRTRRVRYFLHRESTSSLPARYAMAALYPEVVALLTVMASPHWLAQAASTDPNAWRRFAAQVQYTAMPHTDSMTSRALQIWMQRCRRTPATLPLPR